MILRPAGKAYRLETRLVGGVRDNSQEVLTSIAQNLRESSLGVERIPARTAVKELTILF